MLYKGEFLLLVICAFCWWGLPLNTGLGSMKDYKGILEKAGEGNSKKAHIKIHIFR
jgi:hypothetical protein